MKQTSRTSGPTRRYQIVTEEKAGGATLTPKILADFVARQIMEHATKPSANRPLRILDPAIGHGELLTSLLAHLPDEPGPIIEVHGFETNPAFLDIATKRLKKRYPALSLHFKPDNFLSFVSGPASYDLIIANPPYIRTQIMGTMQARLLAEQFGMSGRVDLYYAFILGMSRMLKPQGIAGIIVSNRFMTTRSGASIRQALCERFNLRHIWDLGDTRLFNAAILPAILLVTGRNGHKQDKQERPAFTRIYQTAKPATGTVTRTATDPIDALDGEGILAIQDGRYFHVRHGKLNAGRTQGGVWRIATDEVDTWLAIVDSRSWGTFRDIGKIRVGVKTCADKVFIRSDWQDMPDTNRPELLKPLTTHHHARRFKQRQPDRPSRILYPHEVFQGHRRAMNLAHYPLSQAYFEAHRPTLEGRLYLMDAGREWYEIWVPHDPNAWSQPKLVFRDIAEKPTFWIDLDGSVVNGDCYWLRCQNPDRTDLLWLAASVGNSTFIEQFYDFRFHNKLYAGRRRFMTQYVEKFPLPDPDTPLSKAMIAKAKQIYERTPSSEAESYQKELDAMVWKALTGTHPPFPARLSCKKTASTQASENRSNRRS